MANYRAVAVVFIVLTLILAASTAYLFAYPTSSTRTVTSTQLSTLTSPGATVTVSSSGAGSAPGSSTVTTTTTQTVTQGGIGSGSSSSTSTSSGGPYSVNVVYNPGIGFYLVNGSGYTLYFRQSDPGNGSSSCTGSCVAVWPLFYAPSIKVPPSLNASGFTSVTRPDGKQQTVYNGYPLYYYVKDTKGVVLGQGIGRFFACCSVTATAVSATSTSTAGGAGVSIVKGASTNQSLGYSPGALTVTIGVNSTVTWTNNDATIHTVSSTSVPAGASGFESGTVNPGTTYSHTFTVPGTYKYHCDIHPWMQATIIVR